MACPFFMPTERFSEGNWRHPPRLPLGDGWRGYCTAPGHENSIPTDEELREFCNLGYAKDCERLPGQRAADAVRFCVSRDHGDRIEVCYVCELQHAPAEYGTLEYDVAVGCWPTAHPDARIHKMAACYLESYFLRKRAPALEQRQP